MPTYVYDKTKGRCVLKGTESRVEAPAVRAEDDIRFVSNRCEPELGKGTAHPAPYYVDGQPAFTSRAQAEEFGAAHGLVYDRDRPTPAELRTELLKRNERRREARQELRNRYIR